MDPIDTRPAQAESPNPLVDAMQRAEKLQAERGLTAANGGPEDMPEVQRELMILEGALQGLEQRTAELVAHLRPVLRESPADSEVRMGGEGLFPVTRIGHDIRVASARLGAVTELLESADLRLGL